MNSATKPAARRSPKGPSCPDVLGGTRESTWSETAQAAPSNPSCPPELLARAAMADTLPDGRDVSWQRRYAIANPSCPSQMESQAAHN